MHSRSRAGFTPSGVPDQKKMWGPLLYEYPPTAFTRHAQSSSTFFWDPCCNANYYWGHTKSFPLFPDHYFFISGLLPCCKKWKMCFCGGHLFVGPLFGRTCWTCLNPPLSRKLRSQCTWSMLWSLYHYSTWHRFIAIRGKCRHTAAEILVKCLEDFVYKISRTYRDAC